VFAVIVTPLVEELLFRGVLFPVVARSLNTIWAVIFVSVLFGLAHVVTYGLDAYLILQSLAAGLYLTWLRARTSSLVPSVAAHTALNLYATIEAIVVMNVLK
jgi:membrane protease YdiL (CAAX protease family)